MGAQHQAANRSSRCRFLLQAVGYMGQRRHQAQQTRQRQSTRRQGGTADAGIVFSLCYLLTMIAQRF